APYEDIKAIYDEFFEAMEDLKDEWDIKKYEMLHGTNKTPQQIQDTWTREWYRALNESRPIWDVKNGQTYEEYEINMQMWRENLP
ncbi:MAG: hypothetical protein GWN76_26370, partial [candidate division Zixibacteria bacterium]|nr:hypothetical protein [candidate division Zixibacteria bacterium]NIU17434.1 hypothetical protein [candidate division Zixibacteria bacterium]